MSRHLFKFVNNLKIRWKMTVVVLPLVLVPGAGAEMYQGLGSVLLGGLAVSTVFTVFVIPAILVFVIRMEKRPATNEVLR